MPPAKTKLQSKSANDTKKKNKEVKKYKPGPKSAKKTQQVDSVNDEASDSHSDEEVLANKYSSRKESPRTKSVKQNASSTPIKKRTSARVVIHQSPAISERSSRRSQRNASPHQNGESANNEKDEISVSSDGDEPEEPVEKKRKKQGPKKAQPHNGEYEVKSIVDHKIEDNKKYFLVRWEGYGSEDDSWLPMHSVHCPELIAKYYRTHPDARKAAHPPQKKSKKKKKQTQKEKKPKIDEQEDYDSENVDENEDWEVERILDVHYNKNNKREFLIRWKGFSSRCDSWEPEENLNCDDLIQKFLDKLEQLKNVTQKDLRQARAPTQRFTLMTQADERRLSKRHLGHQRVTYYESEI